MALFWRRLSPFQWWCSLDLVSLCVTCPVTWNGVVIYLSCDTVSKDLLVLFMVETDRHWHVIMPCIAITGKISWIYLLYIGTFLWRFFFFSFEFSFDTFYFVLQTLCLYFFSSDIQSNSSTKFQWEAINFGHVWMHYSLRLCCYVLVPIFYWDGRWLLFDNYLHTQQ